jgi:hypothetical protein
VRERQQALAETLEIVVGLWERTAGVQYFIAGVFGTDSETVRLLAQWVLLAPASQEVREHRISQSGVMSGSIQLRGRL